MTILVPAQPTIGYRARSRSTAEYPNLWDGMVRYFHAGIGATTGTWVDLSGYGWNATGNNGPVVTDFRGNQAVSFDGTNDYYSVPVSGYPQIDAPKTIVARVYVDSVADRRIIFSLAGSTASVDLELGNDSSQVTIKLVKWGGAYLVRYFPSATNLWFDVAYTWDGSNHALHVGGVQVATDTIAGNSGGVLESRIGSFNTAFPSPYFNSYLHSVGLWDRVLPAAALRHIARDPLAPVRRRRRVSVLVPGGGGVTITVASCTHAHTADAPAVTQTHQITAADATHSQTVDSPAITQTQVVAVAEATHAHAADSPTVTQTHVVAAADATHGHTADTVTVTVDAVSVTPADATHGHTADSASVTQTHVLVVAEATHGHTAASPAITQTHVVAAASAIHSHTADNVTVTLSAAVAASQFWVCIGLEGWFSDRVGIEGWLAEALGLEAHLATAKGIE